MPIFRWFGVLFKIILFYWPKASICIFEKFLKYSICQNSISCIRFPKLDMNNEIVFIFHKIRFFTPIFILLADVSKNWPRNVSKTVRSNSLIFWQMIDFSHVLGLNLKNAFKMYFWMRYSNKFENTIFRKNN